jgi:hypothetical protein
MRLLGTSTLEFESFHEDIVPPYAILSHTWGAQEITYQEMAFLQKLKRLPAELRQDKLYVASLMAAAGLDFSDANEDSIRRREGFAKIQQTAVIAKSRGLDYFWLDTCCIDKTSSAELQEAINSMYRWYQRATYCVVHLEDQTRRVNSEWSSRVFQGMLEQSRWITRGWTLQELIAPRIVVFYDADWHALCEKSDAVFEIEELTGIPRYVLATGELRQSSVAQKMSWAAGRTTTRSEDVAYSLMGLFNVHMPMLYGEGSKSFQRLQEEIIRTTPDDSIFAWLAEDAGVSTLRGMFARSPKEFKTCSAVTKGEQSFTVEANRGLHLFVPLQPFAYVANGLRHHFYVAQLNAKNHGSPIAITLQCLNRRAADRDADLDPRIFKQTRPGETQTHFARVFASTYGFLYPNDRSIVFQDIYVRQNPLIPPEFESALMHCFHFRPSDSGGDGPQHRIHSVSPRKFHRWRHDTVEIPEGVEEFVAAIWLKPETDAERRQSLILFVGFHRRARKPWCKIWNRFNLERRLESVKTMVVSLSADMPESWWPYIIEASGFMDESDTTSKTDALPGGVTDPIEVRMEPGMWQDKISIIVTIEGLQYRG